jgi:hypothetical protein
LRQRRHENQQASAGGTHDDNARTDAGYDPAVATDIATADPADAAIAAADSAADPAADYGASGGSHDRSPRHQNDHSAAGRHHPSTCHHAAAQRPRRR